MHAAVSSVKQWMAAIAQQFKKYQPQQRQQRQSGKSSNNGIVEKIAKMLNIKESKQEPLQAHLMLELFSQQRFFAFDAESINHFSEAIQSASGPFQKGVDYSYTKVLSKEDTIIMFPMAMGVPFYLKYRTPAILSVEGQIKAQLSSHDSNIHSFLSLNVTTDVDFLYSSNVDGRIGFLNTLGEQLEYVVSGVIQKVQVKIPMNASIGVDARGKVDIDMNILSESNKDVDIFHYSSWPYTSIYAKKGKKPVAQEKNTKVSQKNKQPIFTSKTYGVEELGFAIVVEAKNDEKPATDQFYRLVRANPVAAATFLLSSNDIKLYTYTVKYSPREYVPTVISVSASYSK